MDISLDGLIESVQQGADQPLLQLRAASAKAAELGEVGDSLLTHFVDLCRKSGHTWAEIGAHLGVTRQAAQKRFVDAVGMNVTFERFTMRARQALDRATEIAAGFQHDYVGTEHQLLGLFDVDGGLAKKALDDLGIERDAVEKAVLAKAPRGSAPVAGDMPLTPRARKVLEETLSVALELGHNYIGTEHLLLGLYRGQDGLAKEVLEQLGATRDAVKAKALELLAGYSKS